MHWETRRILHLLVSLLRKYLVHGMRHFTADKHIANNCMTKENVIFYFIIRIACCFSSGRRPEFCCPTFPAVLGRRVAQDYDVFPINRCLSKENWTTIYFMKLSPTLSNVSARVSLIKTLPRQTRTCPFPSPALIRSTYSIMSGSSAQFPPAPLKEIATEVAGLLKERKETISVAETVQSSSSTMSVKLNH